VHFRVQFGETLAFGPRPDHERVHWAPDVVVGLARVGRRAPGPRDADHQQLVVLRRRRAARDGQRRRSAVAVVQLDARPVDRRTLGRLDVMRHEPLQQLGAAGPVERLRRHGADRRQNQRHRAGMHPNGTAKWNV